MRFRTTEIEYLGLRIAYDKIMMDPVKVQGVADWPVPHNVTDVRSFWDSPIFIAVLFIIFRK